MSDSLRRGHTKKSLSNVYTTVFGGGVCRRTRKHRSFSAMHHDSLACNLVFRMKFLRPDTIGIIPAQGYRQEEKHSIKAMQWIKYLSPTEGVRIQHARNGGEKEFGPYKVDGYYENENGQKYVLEFSGKFWHGWLHCYNASTVNPVNGMTMCDLCKRTMEKKRYMEGQGYIYVGKW